jgi:23S rRNA pseudouridine2605 synthase
MSESSPKPPESASPRPVKIRLQKFLASCGLGSRRACEEFITAGRVTVDGATASQLGTTVDPSRQEIALDGEPLQIERKKYYALNKPRGVVCTNNDPAGRPRVVDMFPAEGPRLFPVGRLDEESEGLIIVTNDGDLSQKLAHPKYRIYRTYHVQVAGVPNGPALESLTQGHYFTEGKFRAHSVKLLKRQGQSSHLELVLTEGQNREVRRLLARIGHKVMRLKRISFGPIPLGRLKHGEFRQLTVEELTRLHDIIDRNVRGGPPRSEPRASSKRRPASQAAESVRSDAPPPAKPPRRAPKQTLAKPGVAQAPQGVGEHGRPRVSPGRRPKQRHTQNAAEGSTRRERREKPRRGAGRHPGKR